MNERASRRRPHLDRWSCILTLCLAAPAALPDTAVGLTLGELVVDVTGAAGPSVPLEVPPGTAGMQPSLSLGYSSRSGNGSLGVGWSLGGLPVIHRCPTATARPAVRAHQAGERDSGFVVLWQDEGNRGLLN